MNTDMAASESKRVYKPNDMAILERVDNVAVISMNNPAQNLLGPQFLRVIMSALQEAVDTGARATLLKTSLKNFSAGADLALFAQPSKDKTEADSSDKKGKKNSSNSMDTRYFLEFMQQLPIPIVASVRGACLGGGLEIALACDAIIAGKSARLGPVETTIGVAPLMGGVQRLVERIGIVRAKEFAMLGRRHDAETLENMGVINLAVADDKLEEVSLHYAQQLANGPTIAINAIKQLANIAAARGVGAADDAMQELIAPVLTSEDAARGIKALGSTGPGTATFEGN